MGGGSGGGPGGTGKQPGVMDQPVRGVEPGVLQDQHQQVAEAQIPPAMLLGLAVEAGKPQGMEREDGGRRQGEERR